MTVHFRVISIGTLAAHPLWDERSEARTGHATTTLVESGGAVIMVGPALPAPALAARLSGRAPRTREQVTHVFLTNFQPDHRRALPLFDQARWLVHEPELETAVDVLRQRVDEARDAGDREMAELFGQELSLLQQCEEAPDRIAPGVDLFPLPGVTAGNCGLLLSRPGSTVLIAGDAVPTLEHLERGQVLPGCADVEQARESFRESIEIADIIVMGRDNVVVNPLRGM
jgi:glyoxylase-like metal-dependent hydrolase (beta-lactamase superfamily II)